jgi:ribosomal-protein-serine acetyltransferase
MTPGGAPPTFTIGLDERCHLRLYEQNDVDELYALVVANRKMLARWMPWAPTLTREDTAEFIHRSRRQWAANEGFQAAIVDGGTLVGTIGFGSLHWPNRSVAIGYWLGAAGQGRGTMTRSVAALVRYAFEVYRLNRVEIRVGTENGRSRAIPERLGFSHEGTLRCAEWVNERFINHEVYALLVDEWRPSRADRS